MNARQVRTLMAIDRNIDRKPESLSPEKLRLYRELLIAYVSESAVSLMRQSRVPTFKNRGPAAA